MFHDLWIQSGEIFYADLVVRGLNYVEPIFSGNRLGVLDYQHYCPAMSTAVTSICAIDGRVSVTFSTSASVLVSVNCASSTFTILDSDALLEARL